MKKHAKPLCQFTLIILISILQSCGISNRIYKTEDLVLSSKRYKLEQAYSDRNRRSPLLSLSQSIVKEVKSDHSNYLVFDILTLPKESFNPSKEVFFIIDDKVYNILVANAEIEQSRNLTTQTSEIKTSDSTSVSLITGYSEKYEKKVKFSYVLNEEIVKAIRQANSIKLQYYAGPDIILVKIKGVRLRKIKKLFDKG